MVGGTRKIVALYGKFKAVASGSTLGSASRKGQGRGRGKGNGKSKGKVKGARPLSPVASSPSSEEEEVPSAHASGDEEEVQEEQEQVEEEAVGSQVWLRGPSTLRRRLIPLERCPMIRPSGKK